MKKHPLNQRGMGFMELLMWAGLVAALAWAGWQLFIHPESLNPKPADHNAYEDTHPSSDSTPSP